MNNEYSLATVVDAARNALSAAVAGRDLARSNHSRCTREQAGTASRLELLRGAPEHARDHAACDRLAVLVAKCVNRTRGAAAEVDARAKELATAAAEVDAAESALAEARAHAVGAELAAVENARAAHAAALAANATAQGEVTRRDAARREAEDAFTAGGTDAEWSRVADARDACERAGLRAEVCALDVERSLAAIASAERAVKVVQFNAARSVATFDAFASGCAGDLAAIVTAERIAREALARIERAEAVHTAATARARSLASEIGETFEAQPLPVRGAYLARRAISCARDRDGARGAPAVDLTPADLTLFSQVDAPATLPVIARAIGAEVS